jgi:hypothetical protein
VVVVAVALALGVWLPAAFGALEAVEELFPPGNARLDLGGRGGAGGGGRQDDREEKREAGGATAAAYGQGGPCG